MCNSVFSAAASNQGKVIGVDVDQAAESSTVITSSMKGLREGTIYALAKFFDGKWDEIADETISLGVNDDAVGLPTEASSWRFKKFTVNEYETLMTKLKDGTVVVDNEVNGHELKKYSNVELDWVR